MTPEGDVALGIPVDMKYSSPDGKKNNRSSGRHYTGYSWCRQNTVSTVSEAALRLCSWITSFILSKGDDVLVVVVYESREGAGQAHPHTYLIVFPLPCVSILLQTHQTPRTATKWASHYVLFQDWSFVWIFKHFLVPAFFHFPAYFYSFTELDMDCMHYTV